jgi:CHAT domain-containing protein/Tfp pilus assembly protein PilF
MDDPSMEATIFTTWGFIYFERGDFAHAQEKFVKGLDLVRQQSNKYQQSSTLLNLCAVALQQEHFDEAIDWAEAASKVARSINARILLEKSEGNIGWADYKLGNFEEALQRFQVAEEEARALNAAPDQMLWQTNIGLSLYRLGHLQEAESHYKNALKTAESRHNAETAIDGHAALAELLLQSGDIDAAAQHTEKALAIARSSGRTSDEMDALFLQSLIAIRQKNTNEATQTLVGLDQNPAIKPSLRWQVKGALANAYAATNNATQADKWYRQSITTFETQRETINREESKLPFSSNADQLYDDYVRFLVNHNKTNEALQWLDLGRARTLEEGLGVASPDFNAAIKKPLDAPAIARRLHSTILIYTLAPEESYLWAVNASGTHFFKLPPQAEIDAHVKKYQRAILGSRDTLSDSYTDGMALYRILVEPAANLIPKDSPVFIIPDGSLTGLNFETLLAPGGGIHYWIKDATITNASSLKLLAAFHPEKHTNNPKKLLLIGNPISPDEKFPNLPNASTEIANVARHFQPAEESIFIQKQALPSAYTDSAPGDYSLIHFVAHGTSSSASPLDSAIVLTRNPANPDSFKLYARDVIQHPLHADMVAISACYGSGSRVYGGEGLVGLSWAFLRAGAHYVVGSLWEVSDSAAPQIMDRMYNEIAAGRSPDAALRDAKLSMVNSQNVFRKPLYWATFQLYGGA